MRPVDFVVICARGLEVAVAGELRALGIDVQEERRAAVVAHGGLRAAYTAVVRLRTASRVVLPIATFAAPDGDALYEGARAVPWHDHLDARRTIAVDFGATRSAITDARWGALKTKDAIVDRLRAVSGSRPSVDTRDPDVRVHVHVHEDVATVSIDLSGGGLHRRGYRSPGGEAPLRESLAAGMLWIAGWRADGSAGARPFRDPLCGSGTLPIEAALIARNVAPGVLRRDVGPRGWKGHDPRLFAEVMANARAAERRDVELAPIEGADSDPRAVALAKTHAERAGVARDVRFLVRPLDETPPSDTEPGSVSSVGLLVTNPPYGERIGDERGLGPLYESLGDVMKRRLPGWSCWVLTGSPELAKRIGLRPAEKHVLYNGAIECRFFHFPIGEAKVASESGPRWRQPSAHAEMFANRLAKRAKHLAKWAKRDDVHCYRVYDADLPEYAVAVDRYEDAVHVQEYEPPAEIEPERAEARLRDVMHVVPEVLGVARERVFLKVRRRHGRGSQYERIAEEGFELWAREAEHLFLVNLSDYLDTGLYLDQRLVRAWIGAHAEGTRFLNLFAYTATATVHAAKAGARSTTSVDLSNTYLEWAERNFERNAIGGLRHRLVRADVASFLEGERGERPYDLVFVSPPTFSSSKKMRGTFDIQRDHGALLRAIGGVLAPRGRILFSTHARRFKLDAGLPFRAEDLTDRLVPEDFSRGRPPHRTWLLSG